MTKPLNRQRPISKIAMLGLTVSIIMAVIGVVFFLFISRTLVADDRARQHLESGIPMLPIPIGCSEQKRSYSKGDIDAVPTYSLGYKCDTSGAEAHDSIVAKLKDQGFTVVEDFSLPSGTAKGAFYSFSYSSQDYRINYRFLPGTAISLETQSIEQLYGMRVTEIATSLTRN